MTSMKNKKVTDLISVFRSTLPVWEELLLFNENFNYYFTEEYPKVIVFFEVIK